MNRHENKTPARSIISDQDSVQNQMMDNRQLVDRAMDKTHGALGALFADHRERVVVREYEMEQLKAGFEYRRRALALAVEARLAQFEEACNDQLRKGKSEVRRSRQEFFAEQKLLLQTRLDEYAAKFLQHLEQRLNALEQVSNQHLRAREEARLYRAYEQFQDTLEGLTEEFAEIVNEGIRM